MCKCGKEKQDFVGRFVLEGDGIRDVYNYCQRRNCYEKAKEEARRDQQRRGGKLSDLSY